MKMYKKVIAVLLIFALFLAPADVLALESKEPSQLYAKAALLMDASNGRVLFEKKGYDQMPMASTTKIMTCIYTLENGNLNDTVTISRNAANQPKVRLGMQEGQQYKLRDLLYALMLESYNDCAVAIAEHVSGSVEKFCYDMSNAARNLGAYNTNFETPNGLDSQNHYTTCYDLALITRYAIQNPDFLKVIQTPSYSFSEKTKGSSHTVNNKDAFLSMYEGAIGVKTGFTGNAGYCFVGAVKKEDRTLISVVLGCGWPPNKTYKWKDTTKLMNYGVVNFTEQNILDKNLAFSDIPVENGITKQVKIGIKEGASLLLGKQENVRIAREIPETLTAPVKTNDIVGNLTILVDEKIYKTIPVYANSSSDRMTFEYVLKKVILKFVMGIPFEFPIS